MTKFATRQLGEIVDQGVQVRDYGEVPGAAVAVRGFRVVNECIRPGDWHWREGGKI